MSSERYDLEQNRKLAKDLGFAGAILVGALLLLPLIIFAIPSLIILRFIKKRSIQGIITLIGAVIFGFLVYSSPYMYLGIYEIMPFEFGWLERLISHSLTFSSQSIFMYVTGGFIPALGLSIYTDYVRKKKVNSIEDERVQFKNSVEYKKVQKKKNTMNEKVQKKWREKTPVEQLLIGINEKGKPYHIDFKELNHHMLAVATTGGGKTILLLDIIEYAMRQNMPMIFIDGKGSLETIQEVETITKAHNKKLKVFSDQNNVTYNPLKHGNSTVITDKLQNLVETESKYYTEISNALVNALIQFIDDYGYKRDLHTFAKFLNPQELKNVLYEDMVEVVEEEQDNDSEEAKKEKPKFEVVQTNYQEDSEANQEVEEETEKKAPEPKKKRVLSDRAQKHKTRLFERYKETDQGEDYLFANASSVRTQIYLLLDSELGHLFEEKEDGLDLVQASDQREAVFVSFDGTIYDDFIRKVARFLILDINYLVSVRNRTGQKDNPFLAIYDEFGTYANDKIVDSVNKSRSAGFHCCIATQTLSDLEKVDPTLPDQIIGNTNTHMIGQTNNNKEIQTWIDNIGTYKDVDLTTTTEKQDNPMNSIEYRQKAGTVRNVDKYKINPDEIRALRQGKFVIHRKATSEEISPDFVYARYPLIGLGGKGLNEENN